MEGHTTGREAALPIDEYSKIKGPGRRAADHYAEISHVEKQRKRSETFTGAPTAKPKTEQKEEDSTAPDLQSESITETIQLAKNAWIHFGHLQAQAKSKTRWQTYALVLTVLFVGVLLADVWLYMDRGMYARENEQNIQELSAARMELTTASAAAVKADRLQAENDKLFIENTTLKTENLLLSDKIEMLSKSANNDISQAALVTKAPESETASQQQNVLFNREKIYKPVMSKIQKNQLLVSDNTQDTKPTTEKLQPVAQLKPVVDGFAQSRKKNQEKQNRIGSIRKGLYPEDMTKDELLASLGEPDRIYKGRVYEQLVYFNHSPRRFWFKNGPYFEQAE